MNIVLKNLTAITPFREHSKCSIVIENSKITQIGEEDKIKIPVSSEIYDFEGNMIIPGIIDLHIHGGGGYDFAEPDFSKINILTSSLLSHGITGILITICPQKKNEMIKIVRYYAENILKMKQPNIFIGLHLEGPFLNKEMHGAMDPETFWEPDIDDWYSLFEAGRGTIKLMTVSPELPGILEIIRHAAETGIVLSMGHTKAKYEDVLTAIDNGITQVTHIYNAMPTAHHRDPGVLGASYISDEIKVQLIADCIHVHPATIRFLYRIKGANGIILVSDAIPHTGKGDGKYKFAGQQINIKGNRAFLDDGTIAGSCITLDRAIANIVREAGIPLTSAVRMATLNPARVLRRDDTTGIIAVGKSANLVVLDKNFNVLMTVLDGNIVYKS